MSNPLWITYAWSDNVEGDFDYLVQELSRAGLAAQYDKISLVPGRKLWAQIADRISSAPLSGWAYLITQNSLASAACKEELAYALQRALEAKGEEFPLIGLLHGVSIRDVPMPLRVRICVNLANPDWIEEIRAALTGKPPQRAASERSEFVWTLRDAYLGKPGITALELRPRFGERRYWRLAFPSDGPQPISWGVGPSNGGGIGSDKSSIVEGEWGDIGGAPMKFVGCGDAISASASAYAVFAGKLPKRFFFGIAREPFGSPPSGTLVELG
jgi:hypothetical protein